MSKKKIVGGTGITAGGDVTFGDNTGQFAIGQEAAKLGIPIDELSTVNGDLNAAIKETKKEEPDASKIKSKFENAIDTVKEVGDTRYQIRHVRWRRYELCSARPSHPYSIS